MKRILLVVLLMAVPMIAYGQTYLGSSGHCTGPYIEPYGEYNANAGDDWSASGYGNYPPSESRRNSDGYRFGLRLNIPLATTCTKEYRAAFIRNEQLKQQLEMLKLCARYQGLELGDTFAEVREMCKGVRAKEIAGMTQEERDVLIKGKDDPE